MQLRTSSQITGAQSFFDHISETLPIVDWELFCWFSHLFYAVQIIKNNFFSHLYLSVERLLTKIWKNYITTLLTQQINIQQINIAQIRIQRVHLSSWLQYILVDINIVRSSWKILKLKSPNFNHSMVHMNRQCYIFFLPLWWSWTEHISSGCCCLPWN